MADNWFHLHRDYGPAASYLPLEGRLMNLYSKRVDVASPAEQRPAGSLRVGILTHICWPETADFKNMAIARALAQQGHHVTIITGFPNYPLGRLYDGYSMRWRQWETVDGVRVLRLPLYPDHSQSGIRRMINYLSFTAAASTLGLALSGPIDVLFVYSPPMTLGIPARLFKLVRGSKILLDVVDLWPDAVRGSGMTRSRAIEAVTGWFARQAYGTADEITSLTPGFAAKIRETLRTSATPVHVRPPWSRSQPDGDADQEFYRTFDLDGKYCVVHTGNLGPFQDLETVIEAARQLRSDEAIRIVLIGGGRDLEALRAQIAEEGLRNVVMTGPVPSGRIPGILAGADATLVSLRPGPYLDMNLPSKLAAYLAAGKPVVANAGGDVAKLVSDQSIGVVCDARSAESLADAIRRVRVIPRERTVEIALRARRLHARSFEQSAGVLKYVSEIESIGGMMTRSTEEERERISRIYAARRYDTDPEYSDTSPVYLQRVQGVERLSLSALRRSGLSGEMSSLDILDFGCGNARWLGRWLAWGGSPQRLHGIDIRPDAIASARMAFPSLNLQVSNGDSIPFEESSLDVVSVNLVFSSILDVRLRNACANEIRRVLRPGGLVLWWDLRYDNPTNPSVRGIRRADLLQLWSPLHPILLKRVTLAPPIAKRLAGIGPDFAGLLEWGLPPARTHLFAALRKGPALGVSVAAQECQVQER